MVSAARDYLKQEFPTLADESDAAIQRQLWQQMHTQQAVSHLASICLRCYISHQIYQTCYDLGAKFGKQNGFHYQDLLPTVLGDEVLLKTHHQSPNSYKSLATTILESYNPGKGSLNTWVSRSVKQYPAIKKFLLEHGVFLISDWALLNDTTPKELRRIFTQMFGLSSLEIEQACNLLVSYHAVYRNDRLQQRLTTSTLPCQVPTSIQLTRIATDLQTQIGKSLSNDAILKQLQNIAAKLREYRIAAQGGATKTLSYNALEIQPLVDSQQAALDNDEKEENEFIKLYTQQLVQSLDQALSQVIEDYINKLQRRRPLLVEKFITALHLLHCKGESMTKIAPQINFTQQFEVTRLLKLNDIRTDVRQKLLMILRTEVRDIAQEFTSVERLQALDQKINEALEEQINKIIAQAESEIRSPIRNQPLRSLFAHRLCFYLDNRAKTNSSGA